MSRILPPGFHQGPLQGQNVIGEVTEALHRFLMDGWTADTPPPRIEEDLAFVPKDREEVVYVYMYRAGENHALQNHKRLREARVQVIGANGEPEAYYERAPMYLDLHYVVAVHSKFRSDAERLMGFVLLRLHEATHLVYRPRRFLLPDGRQVDSTGRPWAVDADGDEVVMEKVALAMVEDLTVGDAINFFTIHEAPYRPFLTYRARCAMEGALISAPSGTTIRSLPLDPPRGEERPSHERPGGRIGRAEMQPKTAKSPFGPPGTGHRKIDDNNESED